MAGCRLCSRVGTGGTSCGIHRKLALSPRIAETLLSTGRGGRHYRCILSRVLYFGGWGRGRPVVPIGLVPVGYEHRRPNKPGCGRREMTCLARPSVVGFSSAKFKSSEELVAETGERRGLHCPERNPDRHVCSSLFEGGRASGKLVRHAWHSRYSAYVDKQRPLLPITNVKWWRSLGKSDGPRFGHFGALDHA